MINFDKLNIDLENHLENCSNIETKFSQHKIKANEIKNNILPEIVKNFASVELCEYIINSTENYTKINGWFNKRHNKYPTNDVPVNNITKINYMIYNIVVQNIYTLLCTKYNFVPYFFTVNDLFIIKYEENKQYELEKHKDGSFISFNILLNNSNEFEGGGTLFELSNGEQITLKGNQGDLIFHRGNMVHSGLKITKGTRYLLVGFLNYLPEFNNGLKNDLFDLNYNSWKINFIEDGENLEKNLSNNISNKKTQLLNINFNSNSNSNPNMDLLEKIVYDISMFHLNRLNIKDNYFIEFWTKDEKILSTDRKIFVHNLHSDKDEKLFKKNKELKCPLLSTVTYLNKNYVPTIFTNIKQFNNDFNLKKKFLLSFPDKLKHICFDGKYMHGVLNILKSDENSRKTLMINLWKDSPMDVEYYQSDIENRIFSPDVKLINLNKLTSNINNFKIDNFPDCFNNILNNHGDNLEQIKKNLTDKITDENFFCDLFEFEK